MAMQLAGDAWPCGSTDLLGHLFRPGNGMRSAGQAFHPTCVATSRLLADAGANPDSRAGNEGTASRIAAGAAIRIVL